MQRTNEEILAAYDRHADTVYRIAYAFLKNRADAEDAVQNTFVKLLSKRAVPFETAEHEKAFLIVTVSNLCRNELKRYRRRMASLPEQDLPAQEPASQTLLQAVLSLPERHKLAVYLYYYEGYRTDEIAQMLHKPASTIRNHLSEARQLLKARLGEDFLAD